MTSQFDSGDYFVIKLKILSLLFNENDETYLSVIGWHYKTQSIFTWDLGLR